MSRRRISCDGFDALFRSGHDRLRKTEDRVDEISLFAVNRRPVVIDVCVEDEHSAPVRSHSLSLNDRSEEEVDQIESVRADIGETPASDDSPTYRIHGNTLPYPSKRKQEEGKGMEEHHHPPVYPMSLEMRAVASWIA